MGEIPREWNYDNFEIIFKETSFFIGYPLFLPTVLVIHKSPVTHNDRTRLVTKPEFLKAADLEELERTINIAMDEEEVHCAMGEISMRLAIYLFHKRLLNIDFESAQFLVIEPPIGHNLTDRHIEIIEANLKGVDALLSFRESLSGLRKQQEDYFRGIIRGDNVQLTLWPKAKV